jgi:hypothetical protein
MLSPSRLRMSHQADMQSTGPRSDRKRRAARQIRAPSEAEAIECILNDFERLIPPGITHWNHPAFFAYFAISGSGLGIPGELLASALNVNAMLWRTSPVLPLEVGREPRPSAPSRCPHNHDALSCLGSTPGQGARRHRGDCSRRDGSGRVSPREASHRRLDRRLPGAARMLPRSVALASSDEVRTAEPRTSRSQRVINYGTLILVGIDLNLPCLRNPLNRA